MRNNDRADRTRSYATKDAPVTYLHPLGRTRGTIVRVSASSVWAELELPTGKTVTFRFSQRQDGEYRMHGKGQYSPALDFPQELADWQHRVEADQ